MLAFEYGLHKGAHLQNYYIENCVAFLLALLLGLLLLWVTRGFYFSNPQLVSFFSSARGGLPSSKTSFHLQIFLCSGNGQHVQAPLWLLARVPQPIHWFLLWILNSILIRRDAYMQKWIEGKSWNLYGWPVTCSCEYCFEMETLTSPWFINAG